MLNYKNNWFFAFTFHEQTNPMGFIVAYMDGSLKFLDIKNYNMTGQRVVLRGMRQVEDRSI